MAMAHESILAHPAEPVWRWAMCATMLTCLGACAPTTIDATAARTVASVGQEVDITLQNVGPGEFETPPKVSLSAVHYVTVVLATPYVPAGETQRFSFVAARPGRAIVTFQETGSSFGNGTAVDTIDVQ